MPIYEYECMNCGKYYEVIQKFSDEPLTLCTVCGGHLHKLISHTSFVLKGTGWYVTDYASPDRKGREKESETATGSEKSPQKHKADSKAESKTATASKP